MESIARVVRGCHMTTFSNDGSRLYTVGDYVCGWQTDGMERIFRVRPLPDVMCLAAQPGGDLIVSGHRDGRFALMNGLSAEIIAVCGHRQYWDSRSLGLSACGRYLIHDANREVVVREIATNEIVWKSSDERFPLQIVPIHDGREWGIVRNGQLEIWSWPFGSKPNRTFDIGRSGRIAIRGNRLAFFSDMQLHVVDHEEALPLFSIDGSSLPKYHWRHDGSLVTVTSHPSAVAVFDSEGKPGPVIAAPAYGRYAFSPVRDDAVMSYGTQGVVLIRNFARQLAAGEAIRSPFEPIRRRKHPYVNHNFPLTTPSRQRHIEATTLAELEQSLSEFTRPCWTPVHKSERSAATCSKFGGVPWIARGAKWPRCGSCDRLMDLFLQLNSKEMPLDAPKLFDGLLQVFVCGAEDGSGLCASEDPFGAAAFLRICQPNGPSAFSELPDLELFDEEHIVAWQRHDDLPNLYYEIKHLGVSMTDAQEDLYLGGDIKFPVTGDKLLGWPDWVHNVQYVKCPRCAQAMRVIFQIQSCRGIPMMLGDGGVGWVSQCPVHRDVLSFHWQ